MKIRAALTESQGVPFTIRELELEPQGPDGRPRPPMPEPFTVAPADQAHAAGRGNQIDMPAPGSVLGHHHRQQFSRP
jgi:hypothetical protein